MIYKCLPRLNYSIYFLILFWEVWGTKRWLGEFMTLEVGKPHVVPEFTQFNHIQGIHVPLCPCTTLPRYLIYYYRDLIVVSNIMLISKIQNSHTTVLTVRYII